MHALHKTTVIQVNRNNLSLYSPMVVGFWFVWVLSETRKCWVAASSTSFHASDGRSTNSSDIERKTISLFQWENIIWSLKKTCGFKKVGIDILREKGSSNTSQFHVLNSKTRRNITITKLKLTQRRCSKYLSISAFLCSHSRSRCSSRLSISSLFIACFSLSASCSFFNLAWKSRPPPGTTLRRGNSAALALLFAGLEAPEDDVVVVDDPSTGDAGVPRFGCDVRLLILWRRMMF